MLAILLNLVLNFFGKNSSNGSDRLGNRLDSWSEINSLSNLTLLRPSSKCLIIYSYSISNNFIREALAKSNIKFSLTNNIQKASVIIGLKKHLRQNFRLKNLAKRKHIPIYSLNQLSMYQFLKLAKKLV